MQATVSVDGRLSDAGSAVVSVLDHGFLFGEGVYETLRTYGGVPFLFDRHVDRLRRSASMISLDLPYDDATLRSRVEETVEAHRPRSEAYVRVILTPGVGDLSYDPASCTAPTLVVIVKDWTGRPEREQTEGIDIALVDVRRNAPQALDPRIKSNNLLNNALAMRQALQRGCQEALMLNAAGSISECAQSSFFVVSRGEVRTPPLDDGLLAGITRAVVLELAAVAGIPVRERSVTPEQLSSIDEAFVTSTTREITPVRRIDGREVGSGGRGPVTRRLIESFRRKTRQIA
jgi:branched-chain amino acid aminotransferase